MALPYFVWLSGDEQASVTRAAIRMRPGSTHPMGPGEGGPPMKPAGVVR